MPNSRTERRGAQVVMLDADGAVNPNGGNVAKAFGGSSLGVFHALWATGQAPPNRLLGLLQQGWMQAGKLGDLADKVEGLGKTLAPACSSPSTCRAI